MIFGGNMSIASKTQEKKLEREITLAQRIEPGTKMKWFDIDISFGAEDHPETELSERNLPFMVKLPVGWHKVAKTLIDNEASLNLIMRKTFIEMRLNLKDLTPVHDTFHGVIPGQSTTPIGWINLEVSCGTEDNKRKEMLMFEVDNFDIGYNCILGRPFLLKFMSIIHTVYATMKMSGPKGVITIKSQGLMDFIMEWTNSGLRGIDKLPDHWVMYFDGSYTLKRAGAGVVLIPPEGDILKYAIQLKFSAVNNIAEYKGLVTSLRLAKDLRFRRLLIRGDS
jgi:hypothetical protein